MSFRPYKGDGPPELPACYRSDEVRSKAPLVVRATAGLSALHGLAALVPEESLLGGRFEIERSVADGTFSRIARLSRVLCEVRLRGRSIHGQTSRVFLRLS